MSIFPLLSTQHDHTPAYTERLGAPLGASVRVRVRTTLPVTGVSLKFVRGGAIASVPAREIAPVSILATQPSVIVANDEVSGDTMPALLDALRKDPGKYNYSSMGPGSISHLAMQLVAVRSGTDIVHVASDTIAAFAPDLAPGLVGDKAHSMVFDVSKVTELVPDFRTTITFDEGARRILAYYDANPDAQQIDEGHDALFDRIAAHVRSAG